MKKKRVSAWLRLLSPWKERLGQEFEWSSLSGRWQARREVEISEIRKGNRLIPDE